MLEMIVVAAVIVLGGYPYLAQWTEQATQSEEEARSRMVAWQAYIKGREFPSGCIDGSEHDPLFLFSDSSDAVGIICQRCTDTLPEPDWLNCPECILHSVDGFLLHVPCSVHNKEIQERSDEVSND